MGAAFLFALWALPLALPHWRTSLLHKYKIRQMVRLVRAPISDSRASGSGIYEVVPLMPVDETGEVAYRIR